MPFSLRKIVSTVGKAAIKSGALSLVPGGGVLGFAAKSASSLLANRRPGASTAGGVASFAGGLGSAASAEAAGLPMVIGGGAIAIRAILARIAAYIGQKITSRQVVNVLKYMGVTAAATALGVGVEDLLKVWLFHTQRRRRGRGISARDIRGTKRTLRKLEGLACAFTSTSGALRPYARRGKHKAGCTCAVCAR